jgi:hypothetical protein
MVSSGETVKYLRKITSKLIVKVQGQEIPLDIRAGEGVYWSGSSKSSG